MAGAVKSYRDLDVRNVSMNLAEAVYRVSRTLPQEEAYGVTSQLRCAAASIPANIAEGDGRESTAMFLQFLRLSQGSLKELETHTILAQDIELLTREPTEPVLVEAECVAKMLRNLIRALQAKEQGS